MIFNTELKNGLLKLKELPLSNLKKVIDELKCYDFESQDNEEYFQVILKLTIETQKLKISDKETAQLLKDISFNDDQIKILCEFMKQNDDIYSSDSKLKFLDLEWRLEAKIASRSCHNFTSIEPKILIKMNVDSESSLKHRSKISSSVQQQQILMTTTPSNLLHVIQKLEQALTESKSLYKK